MDDQVLRKELTENVQDPLLDLNIMHDVTNDDVALVNSGSSAKTPSSATLHNMIKRFNQHSIMVLKAAEQQDQATTSVENTLQTIQPSEEPRKAKRARIHEAVSYEDLEGMENNEISKINLTRIERYLNGPTTVGHAVSNTNGSHLTSHNVPVDSNTFKDIVQRWMEGSAPSTDILSSSTAVQVLGELSVGGALMRGAQQSDTTHLSEEIQKELRHLYSSLSEILRHFWAAFPPTTPQLMEKANKMAETLHRFNQLKIGPFEQLLVRESSEAQQILRPLRQQIEAAFKKQAQWAERRIPPRPPGSLAA